MSTTQAPQFTASCSKTIQLTRLLPRTTRSQPSPLSGIRGRIPSWFANPTLPQARFALNPPCRFCVTFFSGRSHFPLGAYPEHPNLHLTVPPASPSTFTVNTCHARFSRPLFSRRTSWDPSLMFVLGTGVMTGLVGFPLVTRKLGAPLCRAPAKAAEEAGDSAAAGPLAEKFEIPTSTEVGGRWGWRKWAPGRRKNESVSRRGYSFKNAELISCGVSSGPRACFTLCSACSCLPTANALLIPRQPEEAALSRALLAFFVLVRAAPPSWTCRWCWAAGCLASAGEWRGFAPAPRWSLLLSGFLGRPWRSCPRSCSV